MKEKQTKYICIYAASSTQIDAAYFQAAAETGKLLAQHGYGIINGAGNTGLMEAVSNGALQEEGSVTGIIPHFMVQNNWHHKGLTQLIEVETMHQRKQLMAEKSEGAIALPGGYGTLEEILEIITWKQLKLYTKPIIILNINGFYDHLLLQLQHAAKEHFIKEEHINLYQVAHTPQEIISLLEKVYPNGACLSKSIIL